MRDKLRITFRQLEEMPFPEPGKQVGDFPLYDTLLAGFVQSVLAGDRPDAAQVPLPDCESEEYAKALRERPVLTADEAYFLKYYDVLGLLGRLLIQELAT